MSIQDLNAKVGTSTGADVPLMQVTGLIKEFKAGEQVIRVLHDIDLTINQGEMVAIIGQSGSGKSTLMNILGCLDQASAGDYKIFGQPANRLDADELAKLRREHFGFIFQRYHLLGDINARDNVAVPAVYAGMDGGAPAPFLKSALTGASNTGALRFSRHLTSRPLSCHQVETS